VANTPPKPWHRVVELRDDVRSGELSLAQFAADLDDVAMGRARTIYQDRSEFFSLTLPTIPLRDLARGVILRLAGRSDKAVRQLELTYGGGKTHAEIALYHLVNDPDHLPDLPSVHEFISHVGMAPPATRVAVLAFDKLDVERGMETRSPSGERRWLRNPWSVLAFQLAGGDGLRLLSADGSESERDSAPAENLLVEVLARPQLDGLSTLILMDEVLMFAREKVGLDPAWESRLVNFFQYLTQAASKVDRCAIVASLLATDPAKNDELGRHIQARIYDIFQRQREEPTEPVSKDDVAEILRRRFFTRESIANQQAFRPFVVEALKGIEALDEQTARSRQVAEARLLSSYPFHPDLTEVLYQKWTQLEGFQRTRGVLRTFALALRDAESWDTCPLVGVNVFLNSPDAEGIAEAARELTTVARNEETEGPRQEWANILGGELARAREVQRQHPALRHRELEQAVFATFLHSQPIGQKARTADLLALVGPTQPDRIDLEKALVAWATSSWFLDETGIAESTQPADAAGLPSTWRLGSKPNLRHMHADALQHLDGGRVDFQVVEAIRQRRRLTEGAVATGAQAHPLPLRPSDVRDDEVFHYVMLGPSAASESGRPSVEARRFLDEYTGPDMPRVHRNAVVIAVPSRDGLELLRSRASDLLAWDEVGEALKENEGVDPFRLHMLEARRDDARRMVPDAVDQAYSIVVTVSEKNEVIAFKLHIGADPLFSTIKSDARSRIQDTPISAEALLPDGPYDLWAPGEVAKPAIDLVRAFARFAQLPKMLHRGAILSTIAAGCREGLMVLVVRRPDHSVRTVWRMEPDDVMLSDPTLEVTLPDRVTLSELPTSLLDPADGEALPGLWADGSTTLAKVKMYFAGGNAVELNREGYTDLLMVPAAKPDTITSAIAAAIEEGRIWLVSGPASIVGEPVPSGVLTDSATLQSPPGAIPVVDLLPDALPDAWREGEATALAIAVGLSSKAGVTLPWAIVRTAIDAAIRTGVLEQTELSRGWPSDLPGAGSVRLRIPQRSIVSVPLPPERTSVTGECELTAAQLQDFADQVAAIRKTAAGYDLQFLMRLVLGGSERPPDAIVAQLNEILKEINPDLRLE
jgi:hypothetical protein